MASEGPIILSYHDTLLRKSDVELLEGPHWLNDNIITFWFDYLEHDLYSEFSEKLSFFSPQLTQLVKSAVFNENNLSDVKDVISSMNLAKKDLILIAVNDCGTDNLTTGGTHWSLLVYYRHKQSFDHFDSHTGSINRFHAENIVNVLAPLIIPEHESDIELDLSEMECTQQMNSYDCGVHLICNAEAVCRQHFKQDERHIIDISSPSAVKQARRDIRFLISSIRKKNLQKEKTGDA